MRVVIGNVAYCTICRYHMELQDFMENGEAIHLFFHPPGADCPNANKRFRAPTVELEENIPRREEMSKVTPITRMDRVAVAVCAQEGHSIAAVTIESEPTCHVYSVSCVKCGMTLKEIRGEDQE